MTVVYNAANIMPRRHLSEEADAAGLGITDGLWMTLYFYYLIMTFFPLMTYIPEERA